MDPTFVASILTKHDKNADGVLDFEEFLFCYCLTEEKKQSHHASALFRHNREDRLDDRLDHEFRLRLVGPNADDLKKYLQKELHEEESFLKIPVIFLLFFMFLISVLLHGQAEQQFGIQQAIKSDIEENANFAFVGAAPFENGRMGHSNIYDVHSFADFWSWLDLGLVPLFFPSDWSVSESRANVASRCASPLDAMDGMGWTKGATKANTPYGPYFNASFAATTGDLGGNICQLDNPTYFPQVLEHLRDYADNRKTPYLFFSEIVGGMRMRQEQLPVVECEHEDLANRIYRTPCTQPNTDRWLKPALDSVLSIEQDLVNKPGGETVYFRSGTDAATLHRQVRELEDKRWMNQLTSKIEIAFTVYNNHADVFTVVYLNFFLNRGGHIHKVIEPVSIMLNPYGNKLTYIVDALYVVMVVKLFLEEAREIYRSIRSHGSMRGLRLYFFDFKNAVDWASLGYGLVVFVMWAHWCLKVSALVDLLTTANADLPGNWNSPADIYTPANIEFWDTVDADSRYFQRFTLVLAFYPFIIGMRFFSAFSSQPRLGLVTETIRKAGKDLFHFGFVFIITLMIFCTSGLILFSKDVEGFQNLGRTYVSVFRGALGDIDNVALTEVGWLAAQSWWTLLIVGVHMVMLNMLLAIIIDVYQTLKNAMSDDADAYPTLWEQVYEIIRRWLQNRRRQRLPLTQILSALEANEQACYVIRDNEEPKPKLLQVSRFMNIVKGLPRKQAMRLLGNTMDWAAMQKGSKSKDKQFHTDVLQKLEGLDLKVEQLQGVMMSLTSNLSDEITSI